MLPDRGDNAGSVLSTAVLFPGRLFWGLVSAAVLCLSICQLPSSWTYDYAHYQRVISTHISCYVYITTHCSLSSLPSLCSRFTYVYIWLVCVVGAIVSRISRCLLRLFVSLVFFFVAPYYAH